MQPSIEYYLSQVPMAHYYPHLMTLFVIVAVTSSVGIWSARKRQEIEGEGNLLGLFFFLIFLVLGVLFMYVLPAFILISLIKSAMQGMELSANTFMSEFLEPSMRIAMLICIFDNFADASSVKGRVSLGIHFKQFLIIILPTYYGLMAVVWFFARMIATIGNLDPVYFQAANGLFSIPNIHTHPMLNIMLIMVLVVLATFISYGVRIVRADRAPDRSKKIQTRPVKTKSTASIIQEAVKFEREQPGPSLLLYRRAEKMNIEFNVSLFVISIVSPMLASALAFFSIIRLENYRTLTTIFVLAVFGFGLPLMIRGFHEYRRGIKTVWYNWFLLPFTGFYFALEKLWIILLAAFIGILIVLPLLIAVSVILGAFSGIGFSNMNSAAAIAIGEKCVDYVFPIMVIVSFVVLALLVVDLHPIVLERQPSGSRILGAGLVLNNLNVVNFVVGVVIGALLVGFGPFGLLYYHIWEGLLCAGLAGFFFGYTIAQRIRDSELDDLILLGRIRCYIRCGRCGFAQYPISPTWNWTLTSRLFAFFPAYSVGERLKDSLSYLACPDEYKGLADLFEIKDLIHSAEDYASGEKRAEMRALKELQKVTQGMDPQSKNTFEKKIIDNIRKNKIHHQDLWIASVKATHMLAKDQHNFWRKEPILSPDFDLSRFVLFYMKFWILSILLAIVILFLIGIYN